MRNQLVYVSVDVRSEISLELGCRRKQVHFGGQVVGVLLSHEHRELLLQSFYNFHLLVLGSVLNNGLQNAAAIVLEN